MTHLTLKHPNLSPIMDAAMSSAANKSHRRLVISTEITLLIACTFITLIYNLPFWRGFMTFQEPLTVSGVVNLALIALVLASAHFVLLLPIATPRLLKPLLTVLFCLGAGASYYSWFYGTYFDTAMMHNLLETDYVEARELMTFSFIVYFGVTGIVPALLLGTVQFPTFTTAAVLMILCLAISFQTFSSMMRNHKELRYLIAPGNLLISSVQALTQEAEAAVRTKQVVGADADQIYARSTPRPRLILLVVGETQRAANWGLNGYSRETNPLLSLRRDDLINFPDVSSCGTSTAVSLPCMFSDQGSAAKSGYARGHDSLLDIVFRAGVDVEWVDNQSGCKGVCKDVETDVLKKELFPDKCPNGRCFDEVLIEDLAAELAEAHGDQLLVLHMQGSHGPAYFARYPENFKHFTPACETEDLGQCTREEIVNAYDNSIRYTDFVLDQMLALLEAKQDIDSALIYVSDHGESLGELGVYLHGLPKIIAPQEQTQVPMTWWVSPSFTKNTELDSDCLQKISNQPYTHDNLFHSVLGLLDIQTIAYQAEFDLARPCRPIGVRALADNPDSQNTVTDTIGG